MYDRGHILVSWETARSRNPLIWGVKSRQVSNFFGPWCEAGEEFLQSISVELILDTSDYLKLPPIGGVGAGTNLYKYPVFDYVKNSHFDKWIKAEIV